MEVTLRYILIYAGGFGMSPLQRAKVTRLTIALFGSVVQANPVCIWGDP